MDADDYLQQCRALLPPGPAWEVGDGSPAGVQLLAVAGSAAGVDGQAADLLREADPRSTYQMLGDWERVCGLPDSCSVLSGLTLADRRAAVQAKLAATGGQSRAYFIGIAASMGYPGATITEFRARRHGARMGTGYGGLPWNHTWRLNLPAQQFRRRVSGSPFGERYQVGGDAHLECLIGKLKPAHTLVQFKYG
ncbi:YmfQ family protein [Chitinibacteraceae bacterium HSL-7]